MEAKLADMVVVEFNAPDWFERDDFVASIERTDSPAATWHRPGHEVGDMSDVFVTYDHGDGDHAQFLPEDIWDAICAEMERLGVTYAIARILNFE